jgi:hypothetical protein
MILTLITAINFFAFLFMERKVNNAEFPSGIDGVKLKQSITHVVVWCFILSQIAILIGFTVKIAMGL